jgi:hypothetical protein
MKDYVVDVAVIWQFMDYMTVDDTYTLYVKRMDCSGLHKYRYR